jgi:hypothetical protein
VRNGINVSEINFFIYLHFVLKNYRQMTKYRAMDMRTLVEMFKNRGVHGYKWKGY